MKSLFSCVSILALTSVLGCSGKSQKAECQKDTDCKGDRICEKGACVNPSTITGAAPLPMIPPRSKPQPMPVPARPAMPFVAPPNIPNLPGLNPNSLLKGLNLNLKLDLGSGKDKVTLRLKGMSGGTPQFEICKSGKCEELSVNNPDGLKKILDLITGNQGNNPMAKMFEEMLRSLKLNQNNRFPARPGLKRPATPFVPAPRAPTRSTPFRSFAEIQKNLSGARGNMAILSGLLPVQVTSQAVVFKTANGERVEAIVPDNLKPTVPALAKTSKRVIAKIRITTATKSLVKGMLTELEIPK